MTEQELIKKLQTLKQIKPNTEWVTLSKTNILTSVRKESIFESIFQRRMVFAFATLLFVFVGVAGLLNYQLNNGVKVASLNSTADAIAEATLRSNVADYKAKAQILADVVRSDPKNSEVAIKEVKEAAKNLTANIHKNPELAKTIALDVNNNNTLLDVPGGSDASEVKDMYAAVVMPLLKDLEERTLPELQKIEVKRISDNLKKDGNSYVALRDILLVQKAAQESEGN